jgi:hypothetical protein
MLPSKIFNHVAFVEEYCHCLPADDSELYLRPGPLFKNLIILKLSL